MFESEYIPDRCGLYDLTHAAGWELHTKYMLCMIYCGPEMVLDGDRLFGVPDIHNRNTSPVRSRIYCSRN